MSSTLKEKTLFWSGNWVKELSARFTWQNVPTSVRILTRCWSLSRYDHALCYQGLTCLQCLFMCQKTYSCFLLKCYFFVPIRMQFWIRYSATSARNSTENTVYTVTLHAKPHICLRLMAYDEKHYWFSTNSKTRHQDYHKSISQLTLLKLKYTLKQKRYKKLLKRTNAHSKITKI